VRALTAQVPIDYHDKGEPVVFADDEVGEAGSRSKRLKVKVRRTRNLATAAGVLLIAGAVIGVLVLRNVGRSSPSSASTVQTLPPRLEDVCGRPSSQFARFWEDTTGGISYGGTVRIGDTDVPAMSMYVSGGAPGEGVLCVTTTSVLGSQQPIRAATTARAGAIAYLGVSQGQPFGAVRPGVTRVTVSGSTADVQVFTTDGRDVSQLQGIGDGWHAFDSPYGYSGAAVNVTARAYDAQNQLLETLVVSIDGARVSASPSGSR